MASHTQLGLLQKTTRFKVDFQTDTINKNHLFQQTGIYL